MPKLLEAGHRLRKLRSLKHGLLFIVKEECLDDQVPKG